MFEHNTHMDIDRYHFHNEDFADIQLTNLLFDLGLVTIFVGNYKLIGNLRHDYRACSKNLCEEEKTQFNSLIQICLRLRLYLCFVCFFVWIHKQKKLF